jgi:TolB-like protein/DNA-binding SARP family transcriptional activator/Tfp pilus assembly protein PilF
MRGEGNEAAVAVLELTLFGGFEGRLAGGQAIALPGQKDRALLAILALPPGTTHTRDKLASLLWSDRGDQQARDSLKHSLTRIRQCFESAMPPAIVADRQSVKLNPAAVTSDVAAFERLLVDGTPEAVEQATELYRGDLLDGIGVRDSAFEDWLLVERQRLRQRVEEALTELLVQTMAKGEQGRAAAAAQRLLLLDPLRETACRALMQIHAERTQVPQAIKLYEALRDRMHRELGVKPEPQTTELYESIRQRRIPATPFSIGSSPIKPDVRSEPKPAELPIPSKPSIAVLPFQNLSGDPEQDYFADGMVDDIITALSRVRWLFVIARNSSFTYKGRAVDVKQVGRELGVRYVLEGSVRKAGDKVRIIGQLVDTSTGGHLWADRFDGGLADIFDLQDQVTASVAAAVAPKLEQAEIERAKRKPTESLDAYDYYLRGVAGVYRWTREANNEALKMFYRAIELDPDFASAYGMAARCYSQRKTAGWVTDRAKEVAEAARLARRAAELGRDDAVALWTAGIALAFVVGDLDDGATFTDRALALNPSLVWAWIFSGWVNVFVGEPEVAIQRFARAMRLSPQDPLLFQIQAGTASAHFFAGRYAEASTWAETAMRDQPNFLLGWSMTAASNALAGRTAEAARAMARLRQIDPELRLSNLKDLLTLRRSADFAKWEEGLRRAGLPE